MAMMPRAGNNRYKARIRTESYHPPPLTLRWTGAAAALLRVWSCNRRYGRRRRGRLESLGLALAKQRVDHAGEAVLRTPAKTQDGESYRTPSKLQRFLAAPQIQIDEAASHRGTRIHHRPHAAVARIRRLEPDDAAH